MAIRNTGKRSTKKPSSQPKPSAITSLSNFRPATLNANAHTEYGTSLLDRALREDGYVAPMTAAADGEIIDGSNRLEKSADIFTDIAPLVIHHRGDRPIIMVRDDIPNAKTPEAQRIALRANRIAEVDLHWDPQVIATLNAEQPEVTKAVFDLSSLSDFLQQAEADRTDPSAPLEFKEFDENIEIEFRCPKCGFVWAGKPK